MKKRLYAFALLVLLISAAALAQDFDGLQVGRRYWYSPDHEKYTPMEFYREPSFSTASFHVTSTQQFEIVGATRGGWLRLHFITSAYGSSDAFVYVRLFKSALYKRSAFADSLENFRQASIFEEDPAGIKARFERSSSAPAPNDAQPKSVSKLKPWQKYKEKWSTTKPGTKKKFTLLPQTPAPAPAPEPSTGSDG